VNISHTHSFQVQQPPLEALALRVQLKEKLRAMNLEGGNAAKAAAAAVQIREILESADAILGNE